jgi:hypothetical protein
MPRRTPIITRDDLVTRYARILGWPFGKAWDSTADLDLDALAAVIQKAEDMIRDTEDAAGLDPGAYDAWVAEKRRDIEGHTTTVHGITR